MPNELQNTALLSVRPEKLRLKRIHVSGFYEILKINLKLFTLDIARCRYFSKKYMNNFFWQRGTILRIKEPCSWVVVGTFNSGTQKAETG